MARAHTTHGPTSTAGCCTMSAMRLFPHTHLLLGEAGQAGSVAGGGSVQGLAVGAQHGTLLCCRLARLHDGRVPLLAPLHAPRHALQTPDTASQSEAVWCGSSQGGGGEISALLLHARQRKNAKRPTTYALTASCLAATHNIHTRYTCAQTLRGRAHLQDACAGAGVCDEVPVVAVLHNQGGQQGVVVVAPVVRHTHALGAREPGRALLRHLGGVHPERHDKGEAGTACGCVSFARKRWRRREENCSVAAAMAEDRTHI